MSNRAFDKWKDKYIGGGRGSYRARTQADSVKEAKEYEEAR